MNSLEVDWLLFVQDYECANPGCTNEAIHVDHCHSSNEVRGVLCHNCNLSLGLLNEDPQQIAGLINYLSTHV